MGRKRKQPRRIVTFNLNIPLADAIDDLPIKNRSEWANRVLREVIDQRLETRRDALDEMRLDAAAEGASAEVEAIRNNPRRATLILRQSLIENGLQDIKIGRYTAEEYLTRLFTKIGQGEA